MISKLFFGIRNLRFGGNQYKVKHSHNLVTKRYFVIYFLGRMYIRIIYLEKIEIGNK